MPKKLENPYHDEPDDPIIAVPRALCWVFAMIFLALVVAPPVWRNATAPWRPVVEFFNFNSPEAMNLLAQKRADDPGITRERPNFIDHREAWEKELDDSPAAKLPRQMTQQLLTFAFREGNRKTVIGKDYWMFYWPAIDSLTGYGPLKPEPDSVAKDPTRAPWTGPRDVIIEFGNQLEEFGVELVLVPIPCKPMIYPETLGGSAAGPLRHPDTAEFYAQLEAKGVQVIDLTDALWSLKSQEPVFLKNDTHWRPAGCELAAREIAESLRDRPWFGGLMKNAQPIAGEPDKRRNVGDLLEKLDAFPDSDFFAEGVTNHPVNSIDVSDESSPVVLLGDSFTNIYHSESMGWGVNSGLAEHLGKELGMTIDTIAQNGQASTGVRRTLAGRPGSATLMREKKVVIWAIAARDLFLSETVARETQVAWKRVEFNDATPPKALPPNAIVVEAEMTARNPIPDPRTTPYTATLYAAKYRIIKVLAGDFDETEVMVNLWGFQDRKLLPSASFQVGDRQVLTLVPFDDRSDLQGLNRIDNFEDSFEFTPFWAEDAKPLE